MVELARGGSKAADSLGYSFPLRTGSGPEAGAALLLCVVTRLSCLSHEP